MNLSTHVRPAASRREFLVKAGGGFGALALSYLLGREASAAATVGGKQSAQFFPKAKSVIWLFMEGGPSHLDLFDPKPKLTELSGQPMPDSFGKPITAMGTSNNTLLGSKRTFKQYGQSGMWVSDWYPNIAQHVDEMSIIRSCWADGLNHVGSVCQMNTGSILAGRPSMGAWVTYGLGSANRNLPSFVVLLDGKEPVGGPKDWSAGFLEATYQGTQFRQGDTPILHLKPPSGTTDKQQRSKLDFLKELNQRFASENPGDTELEARIGAYELAYQMQSTGPEAVDLSKETEATKQLYGLDNPETEAFGKNCLLARRLVERGVRFVELYAGSGSGWDAHVDIEGNHSRRCRASDKPIAGLLSDLKSRGMLK